MTELFTPYNYVQKNYYHHKHPLKTAKTGLSNTPYGKLQKGYQNMLFSNELDNNDDVLHHLLKIEQLDHQTKILIDQFKILESCPLRGSLKRRMSLQTGTESLLIGKQNLFSSIPREMLIQNIFEIHRNASKGSTISTGDKFEKSFKRNDTVHKSALRRFRRFYRKLFKTQNARIVKKRYVNCKVRLLFNKMLKTLKTIIPEECITDDVVYLAMGIIGLRDPSALPCSPTVLREIIDIVDCARKFSKKKYEACLRSESFKVLLQKYTEISTNSQQRALLLNEPH
ncbi:unnamed protein product [Moneuplotes crassus]|uniref:Uncharacterized protein n=1 Tax=Euplotes crassus TaxID=5936 RepID=A0AAD1Y1Q5_EUPCR|nr:unnamed protein product [Moneuplotes crassus]